ncbi:MAG: hypothetical protein VX341_05790 [Bdellovibrionota bacterium]|nr:hypothetical protein [Bdellovibrionota bacterium]
MKNRASIDIGSNSFILLILDKDKNILYEEARITALGKNLDDNKMFREKSMKDTLEALEAYSDVCKKFNILPSEVVMTATEASRVAKNAIDFYDEVEKRIGFKVDLISGEQEAYYTALGVSLMSPSNDNEIVIMDIGGASTELVKVRLNPFSILETVSTAVGSVRATDWLEHESFDENIIEATKNLKFENYKKRPLVCVAGSMTSIAMMLSDKKEFDAGFINSLKTNSEVYIKETSPFMEESKESLEGRFLFLGKRIDSIVGGIKTSQFFINNLRPREISFSTYGLRYGTLLSGDFEKEGVKS